MLPTRGVPLLSKGGVPLAAAGLPFKGESRGATRPTSEWYDTCAQIGSLTDWRVDAVGDTKATRGAL